MFMRSNTNYPMPYQGVIAIHQFNLWLQIQGVAKYIYAENTMNIDQKVFGNQSSPTIQVIEVYLLAKN